MTCIIAIHFLWPHIHPITVCISPLQWELSASSIMRSIIFPWILNLDLAIGLYFVLFFWTRDTGRNLKKWVSFEFTFSCCSWKILLPLLSEVPDNLLDDERQMAQNFPLPQITAKQLPEGDPQINEWTQQNQENFVVESHPNY